ncbi:hypothetical protein RRG08_044740 [Elysia crispata]|uniref:Uncharacterized protein n=1 Tax=Elysia crispata TaxID=231223 RepID=A0AAE1DH33_9GAST|nr:hypothetical protein RRG08_044740 [Elysia crispata]
MGSGVFWQLVTVRQTMFQTLTAFLARSVTLICPVFFSQPLLGNKCPCPARAHSVKFWLRCWGSECIKPHKTQEPRKTSYQVAPNSVAVKISIVWATSHPVGDLCWSSLLGSLR